MQDTEESKKADQVYRVLDIYTRLQKGEVIQKSQEARRFGVSEKAIQRDLRNIREYMQEQAADCGEENGVGYHRGQKGYSMEQPEQVKFSNAQILAMAKILLDSRAFTKNEMMQMLDQLIACCVPEDNKKIVTELIANERFHYVEPRHKKIFVGQMWEIANAIRESKYIEITYKKAAGNETVRRRLQPLAIMFSEYYFYLAAHIEGIDKRAQFQVADDIYPTIYRIDRINEVKVSKEHFKIPYRDRFEEGEYRKRIQFMYGGKLQRTRFWYKGANVEAVLDRLPTAKIVKEEDGKYLIHAETFGTGIEMWLRSQGDAVEEI